MESGESYTGYFETDAVFNGELVELQDGNNDKDMQVLYTCAETAANRQAGLVTQRPEHRPHQPCVCHRCTPAPTPTRGTESQHHYQSCY